MTILLAEDDVVMRRLTRKMLEAHGYRVLEAEDGNSALDVISSQEGKIDLILTDVVMKGMNGPELVLRMTDRTRRRRSFTCRVTPENWLRTRDSTLAYGFWKNRLREPIC